MARKARRPARRWRPGPGKTLLCLAAAAALAFGNWFAHLPTAERAAFGPAELTLEALGAITADLTDALGLTGRDVAVPYAKTPAPGPAPGFFPAPLTAAAAAVTISAGGDFYAAASDAYA